MMNKPQQKNNHSDWKHAKLGDLYTITSSKRVFQDEWTTEGVPFYRAREVVKLSENGFVEDDLFISRKMFEEYKSKYGVPQKDDLLVTGVGTVGMVYRVMDGREFYFKDGNIIWFKSKGLVSSAFIEQLYKSPVTKNRLLGSSPITTVATYTIDAAKKAVVYLPPLTEQNRIVLVLETWDKAIEKLTQKIEAKRRIRAGLMHELLSGKMRLNKFSEKWETFKLGDICKIKTGKKDVNEGNPDGEYPFFTCAKKYTYSDSYSFDTEAILIAGNGDVGNCQYYNGKFEAYQRTYVLNEFTKDVQYIFAYLNYFFQNTINSQKQMGAMPYIKLGMLLDYEIMIPKLKGEQMAISNILTTSDKEITELERKLTILKKQKRYLLNNLVTGKIRTPETLSTKS